MVKLKYESDDVIVERSVEIKDEIRLLRIKRMARYHKTGNRELRTRSKAEIKLSTELGKLRSILHYRKKRREKYGCLLGEREA